MRSIYHAGCLLFLTILLAGCGNNGSEIKQDHDMHGQDNPTNNQPNAVQTNVDEETAEMIRAVRAAESQVDPMVITYFLTRERANFYLKQAEQLEDLERLNMLIKYGSEALKAGQTGSAIQTLEHVYDELEGKEEIENKEQNLTAIKKLLAVGYLRKGEQENCILNHTSASCIIPIEPAGQHRLREGSEKAIELYEELLAADPDDAQSKYLLNVAYMTLGGWPEEVPKEYLIDPSHFNKMKGFPKYRDVASGLGVDIKALSGGVCLDDFNNDGYIDIMASSWGFGDQVRYFINMGDGTFADRTEEAGLTGVGGGLNMQHADYNNDGHMDFLILRGAWMGLEGRIPNSLIRNNGDGTFTDVTKSAGIYSEMPTQTAVWADFNLDGWLDLFIGNESSDGKHFPCEFYLNQQNGQFRNIAGNINMEIKAFVKGVTAGDLNNDGFPELFLSVLGKPNVLGLNNANPGIPSFRNISESAGVQDPAISFPCWFFDYDNDGFEDIFVSSYLLNEDAPASELFTRGLGEVSAKRPHVYHNNGDGSFTEVSEKMGLHEAAMTMGSNYGDIDNDGYPDFYLATGEPNLTSIVPNKMYLNRDGKAFRDVTYAGGFGNIQKGHGVGFADFDQDGDQDIYTVMGGAFEGDIYQNILYENPGHGNNWVCIRLTGIQSNRSAIGAVLALQVQDERGKMRSIFHTIKTGSSFGGNSLQAEIGIGKADTIESLSILWPNRNRTQEHFRKLPANMIYEIVEGTGSINGKLPQKFEFKMDQMVHEQHGSKHKMNQ